MIRIPFSDDSETSPRRKKPTGSDQVVPMSEGPSSLESRMENLESKLEAHANDLKSKVTDRVDRIESRIHRAMSSLTGEGEDQSVENVIEFQGEPKSLHHLPAASAISALNELNSTLKQTREHLEALGVSVEKMRRSIPARQERESA